MPPKERFALIRSQIEMELARRKERDQSWDNVIDVCSSAHNLRLISDYISSRTLTKRHPPHIRVDCSNTSRLLDPRQIPPRIRKKHLLHVSRGRIVYG